MDDIKTFRQKTRFRKPRAHDDSPGRIIVRITRRGDNGAVVPGSVTKSLTVVDATVIDVALAIENALFGQEATG